MKFLALILLIGSQSALAGDLSGRWQNSEDGTVVNFIAINGNFRQYSSANYFNTYGRLEYKIVQHSLHEERRGDPEISG